MEAKKIDEFGDEGLDQVVNSLGETRGDLSKAFERVRNLDNWKGPINTILAKATKKERDQISRAIAFFTGSEATWSKLKSTGWRVTAAGYYKTIGA